MVEVRESTKGKEKGKKTKIKKPKQIKKEPKK
jgi:hypothetical protein